MSFLFIFLVVCALFELNVRLKSNSRKLNAISKLKNTQNTGRDLRPIDCKGNFTFSPLFTCVERDCDLFCIVSRFCYDKERCKQ